MILSGEPVSTNHIYLYHCRFGYPSSYLSAKGKKLKEQYRDEMWKQRNGAMLTEPFSIEIGYYFKGRGKHDIDNFSKLILDAGNGVLWEDDGLIKSAYFSKYYDKDNPRIELAVNKVLKYL